MFLRSAVSPEYKVQFERAVDYFCLRPAPFVKKEIDISIFRPGTTERYAIEFKFPRNGQYPEQMFKAAQDQLGAFEAPTDVWLLRIVR